LKELVKVRYKGNSAKLAREIGRSDAYLWQLLHAFRAIGEDTARFIEGKLKLKQLALDNAGKNALRQETEFMVNSLNGTTRTYRLVPRVGLGDLTKRIDEVLRPCPVECSVDTIYFQVADDVMEPWLHEGEFAFCDPKRRELEAGAIYLLQRKGRARACDRDGVQGFLRKAKRRDNGWVFTPGTDSKAPSYGEDEVTVWGRVFYAGRDL
jgi:hypothetical protein